MVHDTTHDKIKIKYSKLFTRMTRDFEIQFENSKENNMVHKMEYYTDRFNIFLSFYFETTKLIKLVVKLIEFVYYS